jgi:hypothetical protein
VRGVKATAPQTACRGRRIRATSPATTRSADIDASATSGWNSGTGFVPIGAFSNRFTGRFDRLGHTISNLVIDRPSTDDVGLFGVVEGAPLRNVGLSGGRVTGRKGFGELVGRNSVGAVSASYAMGQVSGTADFICGPVGFNGLGGTVSNSFWDTETGGQATSAGGAGTIGRTTAEMKQFATYAAAG